MVGGLVGAAPAPTPNGYVVDVALFDGDPLGSVSAGTVDARGSESVVARLGAAELLPFRSWSTRESDATVAPSPTSLRVPLDALFYVTVRGTPVGLVAEVEGRALPPRHADRRARAGAEGPFAVRAVLPVGSGRPVRHALAARSATDQTWLEVTVRPAE